MSKLMSFEDARRDIEKAEHKRVALFDKNGKKLVAWNSRSTPIEVRINEIQKRLESETTPTGVYQIHAKHFGRDVEPAIYYVHVGEQAEALADIEIKTKSVEIEQPNENLPASIQKGQPTWEMYNELFREKIELDYRIRELEKEVEDLEEDIVDLEDQVHDLTAEADAAPQGFLSDPNAQSFVQQSVQSLIPIADQYFEMQNKKLALEAMRINGAVPPQMQPPAQQPVQHPQQQMYMHPEAGGGEEEEISEHEEFVLSALDNMQRTQPDLYMKVMQDVEQWYAEQAQQNNQAV